MRHASLFASTALCLSLALPAAPVIAQEADISQADLDLFTPEVQTCLTTPQAGECVMLSARISECSDALVPEICGPLLVDPETVLADEALSERARATLGQMPGLLGGAAPDAEAPADPDTDEALIAADDAEGEPEAHADEDTETAEDEAPGALEALTGLLARQAEETPEPDEADSAAGVEAEAEAEVAEAAELAEALDALEEEAPEPAPDTTADDTPQEAEPVEETTDEESAAALEAEIRALEEERARLLAEADEMAEEAPELVIDEAPVEEFVAPVDESPALDSTQQSAVNRLMETPEVAAALGLLGAGLQGEQADEAESAEAEETAQPRSLAEAAATLADRSRGAQEDPSDTPAGTPEAAEVLEEQISGQTLRTSRDDFASRLSLQFEDAPTTTEQRSGRRDLERAGLAALGALAVGMIINQNRVVARSDERVVVDQGGGDLALWRDDDTILQQDGSTRRIERYDDGSTLTRWQRTDGTQIITVRDVTGRVLRRERVLADGTVIELVDDTRQATPIDVSRLPPPRARELRLTQRTDPELALAMLNEAEAEARALERSFSLRQVRENRELRELVPMLSPDPITFETNRANIRPDEASKLLQVGRLMERLLLENPREIFLIEGHTDATGPAAFNLALSDRRAESVALALTEFFDIPPENLVVQGYGERHLRIATLAAEERNRRVAIRRITPLLWQ